MAVHLDDTPAWWKTPIGGYDGVAITPSDTVDIPNGPIRSIWVGGAGNVALITLAGTTVTFAGCPAGSLLPVMASRVMATNTTATLLVGLR
jgi:hypothetical protein